MHVPVEKPGGIVRRSVNVVTTHRGRIQVAGIGTFDRGVAAMAGLPSANYRPEPVS